ncbi:MAG TPA: preprotein translocase subunit SecE [Candidatus Paceibacterota bacterium]|nr:preprotein translocase subunit SecE [Candidatus Paceibacterota bacterium]HMO82849.1 preprotein translocase subunit SecE [Candidatus Paceibacterota bacterium]
MSNLSNYFKATVAEMKQVTWPTQKQAFLYTILVICISLLVSLFLGAFDYIFGEAINYIVTRY